jgi:hypothetical protein
MPVTARVLPFEEWDRLDEELDPILMNILPGTSRVCVVEDNGQIVGRWLLYPVLHAECVWVEPSKRRGRVGLMLLDLMKRTARSLGFDRVVTASVSDDVTKLLCHPRLRAQVVPGLSFVLPVGDESCP